jgi:hypothetical protein
MACMSVNEARRNYRNEQVDTIAVFCFFVFALTATLQDLSTAAPNYCNTAGLQHCSTIFRLQHSRTATQQHQITAALQHRNTYLLNLNLSLLL